MLVQEEDSMSVIAFAQNKGGTGKTTTCANLGVALAELQQKVILIDLDPQCNLSLALGLDLSNLRYTVCEILQDVQIPPREAIQPTSHGVDLLPSDLDLAAVEFSIYNEMGREQLLKQRISKLRRHYDHILIDCPPSLGLLTINALTAADQVLIPLQCAYLAMKGMQRLLETIQKVKQKLNRQLEVMGILLTMFDRRTLHSKEIQEGMRERFGELIFQTIIPKSVQFDDATVAGEPILRFAPRSEHARSYRSLAKEVLQRVEAEKDQRR
jgi:chromosome partitioning protein